MRLLIYLLFISVFFADYLVAEFPQIPRIATWTPDAVAGLMLLLIAIRIASVRTVQLHPKYMVWGAFMLLSILIGVIVNDVQSGSIFYGLRRYARYIPVFLAPVVFRFSDRDLSRQLVIVLALALLQVPFAIYQRLVDFPKSFSGDVVFGTLMDSGILSVFLVSTLAMLTAYYVKENLRFRSYVALAFVLTVPVALNETTAALVLLPIAIVGPFVLSALGGAGFGRRLVPIATVLAILVGGFTIAYNAQFSNRWGGDITNAARGGENYLYRGATEKNRDYGTMDQIGRLDSIILPLVVLDDPVQWVVGVGIGNAAPVSTKAFQGEYWKVADRYGIKFTTLGLLMWETGVLGVVLSVILIYMIFSDARALARRDDACGALGLGWAGVMVIVLATLFYKDLINDDACGYLMWLFSGHVIAARMRASTAIYPSTAATRPVSTTVRRAYSTP